MKNTEILSHSKQGMVSMALACGNVALVGPSGSGKTHMAEAIAKEMGLDFHFTGALMHEYKLTGFIDATGKVIRTPFREAFEHGGVFLFDEIDGSAPAVLLQLNSALSNKKMDFPDACVDAHPDFKVIAASNTYWTGADRSYVGRNQLDAASLDRFIIVGIDYDEDLERALAKHDEWVDFVQKMRKAVRDLKIRHVISPRASMDGAKLLQAGAEWDDVAMMVVWKSLPQDQIQKVKKHIEREAEAENQAKRARQESQDRAARRGKAQKAEKGSSAEEMQRMMDRIRKERGMKGGNNNESDYPPGDQSPFSGGSL